MKRIKKILFCSIVLLLTVFSVAYATENTAEIFVSQNGNDLSDGTKSAPLKTIEAAKKRVDEIKTGYDRVIVNIESGTYNCESFLLNTENSGDDNTEIVWKACDGDEVILTAAIKIDNERILPLSDSDVIDRIPLLSQNKIRQVKI